MPTKTKVKVRAKTVKKLVRSRSRVVSLRGQLQHYRVHVQDNPMLQHPLSIITCDGTFSMGLEIAGTVVYADTHTPSEAELNA
eukprot:14798919-Ditylum_brightwellii.AAC.1